MGSLEMYKNTALGNNLFCYYHNIISSNRYTTYKQRMPLANRLPHKLNLNYTAILSDILKIEQGPALVAAVCLQLWTFVVLQCIFLNI